MNNIPAKLTDEDYKFHLDLLTSSERRHEEELRTRITESGLFSFYGSRALISNFLAVLSYYLGFPEKSILYGREAVLASHEVFYREWQKVVSSGNHGDERPSVAYCRRNNAWEICVSAGLLWSSALHEWHAMRVIAEYLRDDPRLDPSLSNLERAWYIILAGACRGGDWRELLRWRMLIESSRQQKYCLLLACLEAMIAGDSSKAGQGMHEYIELFKSTDFKSENILMVMSLDGSILLNLAKYKGWELPVSEIARPFLIEFSEEQLTRSCSENSNL
ncbi:hypothetical protein K2X85_05260 [bacterium]|nr:hypothetical protein [bacterium]